MSTVKIVVESPDTLSIGTIDDIPIVPGSKNMGFDDETRGGGPRPVVNIAQGKVFSFETQVGTEEGISIADAFKLLKTLDNVALSAGTTNGDSDADVVGPLSIEPSSDGTMQLRITVTGNPAA